jgi:hypothetical protein
VRRLLLATLVAVAACGGPDPEAARAVRRYDDALIAAYSRSDASGLDRVATLEEAGRIRVLIDIKSGAGLALESRLEAFEVLRAETSASGATVETRERWRYRDRRLEPGRPPGPELVSDMRMRYALVREAGRWKVGSVATLSNAPVAPARDPGVP